MNVKYIIILMGLGLLTVLISSCEHEVDLPEISGDVTFADVKSEVFEASCKSCHIDASSGGLNLASYDNLVGVMSSNPPYLLIEPNNVADSYIYMKLINDSRITGDPMPQGGTISQYQLNLLTAWIENGAPEGFVDRTVATIELEPTAITMPLGTTATLSATAKNAAGDVLSGVDFGWSSSDETVVTVMPSVGNTSQATLTATFAGAGVQSATVTVQAGEVSATVTVTVEGVSTIHLNVETLALAEGGSAQLTATAQTASAVDLPTVTDFTWSSSAPAIATVDQNGHVTALSAGIAEITASYASVVSNACEVTVTATDPAERVTSITLSPESTLLGVGETVTLTATAFDSLGSTIDVTFDWTSDNPEVATVNSSGKVTALTYGTANITASVRSGAVVSNAAQIRVEATLSAVQSAVFNNCTGCHGGAGNLYLTDGDSYNNLVNVPATGNASFMRVSPGDPANSYLYMKVTGDVRAGDQMPLGGQLTAEQIEMIENWIQNGAQDN